MDDHVAEAGVGEHGPGQLLAPGRAQAGPAAGQRHGQAVQRAHRVEHRRQRVGEVAGQVAGDPGLDHDEGPAGGQGGVDPLQHRGRVHLVVDGVEHEHDVEGLLDGQAGGVADLEPGVGQPGRGRLGPGPGDGVVGQVVADEGRGRVGGGQEHHRAPGAAADVGHPGPGGQPGLQPGDQRQVGIDQQLVEGAAAEGVHHVGELGTERGIGHAAALPEGQRDRVDVLGQVGVEPAERRQVGRARPGEAGGVLGRQPVGPGRRVVVDDAAGDHGPQPLPHVPLLEVGPPGQLGAGRGAGRGGGEQAGPVPDVDHEGQHPAGVQLEQPPGERLDPGLVQRPGGDGPEVLWGQRASCHRSCLPARRLAARTLRRAGRPGIGQGVQPRTADGSSYPRSVARPCSKA